MGVKRARAPTARSETLPRYRAVADALIAAIEAGRHPVGTTLPTEHALCEQYAISRFTAREALRRLTEAGLVNRRPRVGTVVVASRRHAPYMQSIASIDDLLQYSADIGLRVISPRQAERYAGLLAVPDTDAAGADWPSLLGLRHRTGDALPVSLTRVWLNPAFADIVASAAALGEPIYRQVEQVHGVQVARIEQRIGAVTLGREDARLLRARPGSAALRLVREYRDAGDRLLELADNLHPAARFGYAMRIERAQLPRLGGNDVKERD